MRTALIVGMVAAIAGCVGDRFGAGSHAGSDAAIKAAIEREFWWSPFVNSKSIHVDVENGVATLRGRAGTWHEMKSAIENAREGGARKVIIRLVFGPVERP